MVQQLAGETPAANRRAVHDWLLSLPGFLLQGEDQKKLDVISNEVFSNCLRQCGRTGIIASEEEDQPVRAGRAGPAVPAWCCGMLQKALCL